jgi:hypothetical protein
MTKVQLSLIFIALLISPAFVKICQAKIVLSPANHAVFPDPSTDTIFVYDTIYQVYYVYDTIFYDDSTSHFEIKGFEDTLTFKQDSTSSAKKLENVSKPDFDQDSTGIIFKTSYTSHLDFNTTAKPDELPKPERSDEPAGDGASKPSNRLQTVQDSRIAMKLPYIFYVRDTLYHADTIVIIENLSDTVFYYKLAPRVDTTIYHQTIIEKKQNIVVVNNVVNVSILKKSFVIVDDPEVLDFRDYLFRGDPRLRIGSVDYLSESQKKVEARRIKRNAQKSGYKSTNLRSSHRDLNNPARTFSETRSLKYQTFAEAGASLIIPKITFTSKNEDSGENVDLLNENTTPKLSYGISAGLKYYRQNLGFETGLNFTRQNFEYLHQSSAYEKDSSYYWDYFDNEKYLYDTTWYLDLDWYLATGQTRFLPNVDSTLTLFTDSTLSVKYDSSAVLLQTTNRNSFSYLEIPLIARYQLVKGKLFCDAAVGLIPSFLISKTGNILSDKKDEIIKTSNLGFDSGFNLAFYGAVTVGYKLSERYAIQAEPFIKRTIFTGIENDNISMKSNSLGIKFTVSFCF